MWPVRSRRVEVHGENPPAADVGRATVLEGLHRPPGVENDGKRLIDFRRSVAKKALREKKPLHDSRWVLPIDAR